jgi:hypothetical protein
MTGRSTIFSDLFGWRFALFGFSLTLVCLQSGARSLSAEPPQPDPTPVQLRPDLIPLDLDALRPDRIPPFVVTATTISQTGLTVPSLWWIREQIADLEEFGGKLLQNWLAYPRGDGGVGRVDLIVNRQLWSLMDYLQRYQIIHRFSTAARDFGYNVRVFDDRATFLGAYTCDFQIAQSSKAAPPESVPLPTCDLLLDSSGKSGLRGGSNLFDEGFPTAPGTAAP